MSKLDKEQVIANFSKAYLEANGKEPQIEAKGGWYSVDGGKNVRLAQLNEMADQFSGGESTQAEVTHEEATQVEATAKSPPVAKVAASKTSAPKKSSAFSVKGFWIEQLDSDKPGSTAPRSSKV